MGFFKSVPAAFAMFSRIPVRHGKLDGQSLRYIMAAFPIVGILIGIAVFIWNIIAVYLGLNAFLRGAGFALIPVFITGGIHLDGFCDTLDALASHAPSERKLEILNDPHIGAFAAIGLGAYLLSYAALASELDTADAMLCFLLTFVLSRCLSGLAVVFFPCAKNSGLARAFADASARKSCGLILSVFLLAAGSGLVLLGGLCGLAALLGALAAFGFYHRTAMREFGGVTGDAAGWFLQICEIASLALVVLSQRLFGV